MPSGDGRGEPVGLPTAARRGEGFRLAVPPIRVARWEELEAGRPRRVDAGGTPIVLVRVKDEVYACGDTCAHKGGPLSEGRLSGTRLACPWHGWMYDVRSGECVLPGRGHRVASYPVRVDAGDVWVDV